MRHFTSLVLGVALLLPYNVQAATTVVEGNQAKGLYNKERKTAQVLVQKHKMFLLRAPSGSETTSPPTITVKAGERFYIANEEEMFIHNVYDEGDSSWVIKKQTPSNVAGVTFSAPGEHSLLCAIHPTMKIKVLVTP
jgi:plastocyanin